MKTKTWTIHIETMKNKTINNNEKRKEQNNNENMKNTLTTHDNNENENKDGKQTTRENNETQMEKTKTFKQWRPIKTKWIPHENNEKQNDWK